MTAASVRKELAAVAVKSKGEILARFFKTGEGQYGAHDVFIGVKVPESRDIAKRHRELPLEEIYELLESEVHEHRLVALVILTERFKRTKTEKARSELFGFYLDAAMRGRVNNWDLVDVTAPTFGKWLIDHPKMKLLKDLAESEVLWERRLAIMFTFAHIRANRFDEAIEIATKLLADDHDLIHKAVGWMLREIGNRNLAVLREFLRHHHKKMPRTMLRYSIEKLDSDERAKWMQR